MYADTAELLELLKRVAGALERIAEALDVMSEEGRIVDVSAEVHVMDKEGNITNPKYWGRP